MHLLRRVSSYRTCVTHCIPLHVVSSGFSLTQEGVGEGWGWEWMISAGAKRFSIGMNMDINMGIDMLEWHEHGTVTESRGSTYNMTKRHLRHARGNPT